MKVMKFETRAEDEAPGFYEEVYDLMDNVEKALWITGENRQNPTEPDEWGTAYAVIPREGWPTGCGVVVVEAAGAVHRYVVDDIYDFVDEDGNLLRSVFGHDTHVNPKLMWYQEI
jgi:hypothetical protein